LEQNYDYVLSFFGAGGLNRGPYASYASAVPLSHISIPDILSVAAFVLQNWIVVAETIWPAKAKVVTALFTDSF
jgi:hypothetical protein